MKIKLIEPSWYLHNGELAKQKKHFYPAVVLPYLAALIPQKHDIILFYPGTSVYDEMRNQGRLKSEK